ITQEISLMAFSADGRRLVFAPREQRFSRWDKVRLWDARSGRQIAHFDCTLSAALFCDGGAGVVLLGNDGGILWGEGKAARIYSTDSGRSKGELKASGYDLRGLVSSADGRWIASRGEPGLDPPIWRLLLFSPPVKHAVLAWDSRLRRSPTEMIGHEGAVTELAFSPDGTHLASSSEDGTVRIWDPKTGASRAILKGHDGAVRGVSFSPDGAWLASLEARSVVLRDARSPGRGIVIRGHHGDVTGVAFSPDGRQLAVGSDDRAIRLWEIRPGMVG